jgi:hypothetical protein
VNPQGGNIGNLNEDTEALIDASKEVGLEVKCSENQVYVQNFWGSGLCPSYRNKEIQNDVSETGSVSVLMRREKGSYSFKSLRKS